MGQVGPEPCWDRGQEEAEDGNGLWDRAGAVLPWGTWRPQVLAGTTQLRRLRQRPLSFSVPSCSVLLTARQEGILEISPALKAGFLAARARTGRREVGRHEMVGMP